MFLYTRVEMNSIEPKFMSKGQLFAILFLHVSMWCRFNGMLIMARCA
jgi:hypothetical protein